MGYIEEDAVEAPSELQKPTPMSQNALDTLSIYAFLENKLSGCDESCRHVATRTQIELTEFIDFHNNAERNDTLVDGLQFLFPRTRSTGPRARMFLAFGQIGPGFVLMSHEAEFSADTLHTLK